MTDSSSARSNRADESWERSLSELRSSRSNRAAVQAAPPVRTAEIPSRRAAEFAASVFAPQTPAARVQTPPANPQAAPVRPQPAPVPPADRVQSPPANPHTAPARPAAVPVQPSAPFGDRELDAAYREYLRQCAAEHNRRPDISEEDVGILIQEDWLAAQGALQSEPARRHLKARQTVLLRAGQAMQPLPEPADSGSLKGTAAPGVPLPDIAVHVYALPDLPATRRIKVLSEQELVRTLHDKLKPHLANAVGGMVRRALQKKLAILGYELQTLLDEETGKLVEDVLAHHLNTALRTAKDAARDK